MKNIKTISFLIVKNCLNTKGSTHDNQKHLEASIDWLLMAHKMVGGKGFSRSYSLIRGWGKPYPETTGYIIPTLLNFINCSNYRKEEILKAALKSGEWLISIQNKNGSFFELEEKRPLVFDSGQILFGLCALYRYTGRNKYYRAINKTAEWLSEIQNEAGHWGRYDLNNFEHSYCSRVSWALLEVYNITANSAYKETAQKQLDWTMTQQKKNGWFDNSYFVKSRYSLTHLINYVLQGLIESGLILGEQNYIYAAQKTGDILLALSKNNKLRSYYNDRWENTNKSFCLTGLSQTSIIFKKLYKIYTKEEYLNEAYKIDKFVTSKQITDKKNKNINGGIAGSFPLWGKYIPFCFVNWAVKFYIDSMLLFKEIEDNRKYIIYGG